MAASASLPAGRARRRPIGERGLQGTAWLVVAVCVLVPVVPLLYASVQDKPIYAAGRSFTLGAYGQLFGDPAFWTAVVNTLEFAAITTGLSVVLGATFAVLCTRTDVYGRQALRRLFVAPILLPPLGVIIGWNALYGSGGYGHDFLNNTLHVPFELTTVPGMAMVGTAVAVPVVFLVCQGAVGGVGSALEDAARSAGASPLRAVASVTVPMLRPALANSGLLVFTLAIESLGLPLILGSPSGHDLVASYLYNEWSSALTPDPPIVSAGATVLLAVACLLLLVRRRLLGDEARFVTIAGRGGQGTGVRLRRLTRIGLATVMLGYLGVTTFAPIAALVVSSVVTQLTPLIAPWHLLTLQNWRALEHGAIAQSIRNTLQIAVVGALLTTIVVAFATAVAHRSRFRLRGSLPFLMLFPRAIPGLIIGIGFFWTFLLVDPPGSALRNSLWGIMLALSVRSLTLAYLVMSSAFATVSSSLDDAARSVGARWTTTMTRIDFPILRPALFISLILLFVSILSDYDPALFLVTPGHEVMGVTMVQSTQQGTTGPVAAMAVIQIAITIVAIAVGARLFSTRMRERARA